MEIVDIRQMNQQVQEYCAHVGGCGRIETFYRLKLREEMFFSQRYIRVKKRNSYTILYKKETMLRFGLIVLFLSINRTPVALVQKLMVTARFKDHIPIFKVSKSELYDL